MPTTARQARFMGADLHRAEQGKRTKTGMSAKALREYLHKAHNTPGDGTGRDADRIPVREGRDNDYAPHR